jgi:hypothetical protein
MCFEKRLLQILFHGGNVKLQEDEDVMLQQEYCLFGWVAKKQVLLVMS